VRRIDQEGAEVAGVVRIRQVARRRGADVAEEGLHVRGQAGDVGARQRQDGVLLGRSGRRAYSRALAASWSATALSTVRETPLSLSSTIT
jgi:hypothetical protein